MARRGLHRLIVGFVTAVCISCAPAPASPHLDPARATVAWLAAGGFRCDASGSAHDIGSQWSCLRGDGDEQLGVVVDSSETSVTGMSAIIAAPIRSVDAARWEQILSDSLLESPPLRDRPVLRTWLLDHIAATAPTMVDGARVSIDSTSTSTTVAVFLP